MSAASPAHNQVRRNVAAAPSRGPQPQAHAHAQSHAPVRQPGVRAGGFSGLRDEDEPEMRLNLSDIPRPSGLDLDVEGLKPSLLSRLLSLVVPLDRR